MPRMPVKGEPVDTAIYVDAVDRLGRWGMCRVLAGTIGLLYGTAYCVHGDEWVDEKLCDLYEKVKRDLDEWDGEDD